MQEKQSLPVRAPEPRNKTTTAAFAKGCNVVTGGTAVAAWTMADLAKVKLAVSANGVAIGGRRYQLKIVVFAAKLAVTAPNVVV